MATVGCYILLSCLENNYAQNRIQHTPLIDRVRIQLCMPHTTAAIPATRLLRLF